MSDGEDFYAWDLWVIKVRFGNGKKLENTQVDSELHELLPLDVWRSMGVHTYHDRVHDIDLLVMVNKNQEENFMQIWRAMVKEAMKHGWVIWHR